MEQFPRQPLAEWAARQPELRALGVFGSRAGGTGKADSDLDIWIELVASDEDRLPVFVDNRRRWTRELTNLTGLVVKEVELRGVSGSVVGGVEVFRRAD